MNEPVVQQSAEECSECGALQALQTLPHKDDTEEFPRIIADNWLWIVLRGWWTLGTNQGWEHQMMRHPASDAGVYTLSYRALTFITNNMVLPLLTSH